jgi:hypothetical protein
VAPICQAAHACWTRGGLAFALFKPVGPFHFPAGPNNLNPDFWFQFKFNTDINFKFKFQKIY